MTTSVFVSAFARLRYGGPKRRGLLRNAAVALGNSGNPQAVAPLRSALGDPDTLIRGHAAWALGQFDQSAARAALQHALATEDDPQVRAEISVALGDAPPSLLQKG